jgi:phosphatidylserine/phosphatidylglycerophosphate/cardiolipin synthase-like enzyme
MNINDKYFLHWRDTHLRLTGSSVAALQFLFLDTWVMAGGKLDRPVRDYFPQPEEHAGKMVQIVPDDPQADPSTFAHITKYLSVSMVLPGPTNAGHHSPSASEDAVSACSSQITFLSGEYPDGDVW